MCGIIGFITNERHKNFQEKRKFITQGLVIDQLRGEDATGVFYVQHVAADRLGGAGWLKNVTPGSKFAASDEFRKLMDHTDKYKYFTGHNRFSTMGTRDKIANAHPFSEGPITLVHNGGLHTMHDLPTAKHKLAAEVEVDSHVICHNLAAHSVADVVKELNGAYVLVWHDSRDDSLNVIRNDKRPLAMAQDRDSDTIYYASEADMLVWLASRNNIRLKELVQPKPGRWLKFTPDDLMKPIATDLEMHKFKTFSQAPHGRTGGWEAYENDPLGAAFAEVDARAEEARVTPPFSHERIGKPPRPPVVVQKGNGVITASPSETIMINGKYVPIPSLARELLDEYQLSPFDTYCFTPTKAEFLTVDGTHYGRITGCLDDGTEAYVQGVPITAYSNNRSNDWVVAPLVPIEYESESGETETMMLVRVVRYMVPNDFHFTRTMEDEEEEDEIDYSAEDVRADMLANELADRPEVTNYIRGPNGVYLPRGEWMALVSKGCVYCKDPIYPRMEDELTWLSNKTPVCKDCLEDMKEEKLCRTH